MKYTLEHVKNKHLSICERTLIQLRLKDGRTVYSIAREIGCAYNTVKNEIRRGSREMSGRRRRGYRAETGQTTYERNRAKCHRTGKFPACGKFIYCVESSFSSPLKQWSVDAAVGRLRLEKKFTDEDSVCTKTIYNWIHKGLLNVKVIDLPESLKRKKHGKKMRAGKMRLGTSIEKRPAEVAERKTFGHWELDTVVGKKKGRNAVVLTLVERLTDFYMTRKIPAKMAGAVNSKISQIKTEFGSEADKIFITLTTDRGLEFASLAETEKTGKTKVYFAHPYSSYERGINERHNRILRRYVKKGATINKITEEELEQYEDLINGLPRKRLGYRTPSEVFNEQLDLIYKL
ncbi:IS30 family transposase [Treponema sp.]|uniref:IS30 family transposase n=1 Tax=Treponema sp. TaxID=166 RepID=UPI003F02C40C